MLVDTHCHLDFNSFDQERQAVVERARAAGVGRILNALTNLLSAQQAVRLSEAYPEVYTAVGVHPNDAATWDENSAKLIRQLAEHPKVVAIGEIGLDYYRDRTPADTQRAVFRQQLSLAGELSLPVIVHNRNASQDVLQVLAGWVDSLKAKGSQLAERPGVLHSFSETIAFARDALAANFYLGISGPVTYKNSSDLQEVVKQIPADRILIETDAPFLTPHPNRGKRNEPANVVWVARKIAELRNTGESDLIAQTTENAARLFGW